MIPGIGARVGIRGFSCGLTRTINHKNFFSIYKGRAVVREIEFSCMYLPVIEIQQLLKFSSSLCALLSRM